MILSSYLPLDLLVHGDADGLDLLAEQWAKRNGIAVDAVPCTDEMWKHYGLSAGNIRNRMMLDKHPDAFVVAGFPGPMSKGTWNCMKDAVKKGMTVDSWPFGEVGEAVRNWKP